MPAGIQWLWPSFQSHARRKENGDQKYAITNSLIKISLFLLRSVNKVEKIHHVTTNLLMYILGQKTYTTGIVNLLCVRNDTKESWNMSSNYNDLENHMLSASRTSNFIVIWLKIFTLLYWMDWSILQAYLWKHRNGIEPFIHD